MGIARVVLMLSLASVLHASPYSVAPAADGPVSYLIVAADEFAGGCDDLLAYRASQGHTVGVISVTAACAPGAPTPERLAGFLADARARWGTRFVLLVGDAVGAPGRTVPTKREPSGYYSPDFLSERELASDYGYSALGAETPQVHVGRLPADSPEELQRMIRRTIAYETTLPGGAWQGRVAFVAGNAGFGPLIDAVIEAQFTQIVARDIPPAYEVRILHARPQSPYCPPPLQLSESAVDLLREGSLFFVYVGHGVCGGFDDLRWMNTRLPIMDSRDLRVLTVRGGLPVMVSIACDTARIDEVGEDSIGEDLMKLEAGPAAYIGSTRICQPYGNALLGRALVETGLREGYPTVGEALDAARAAVLGPDASPFRTQANAMAGAVQGKESLAGMRRDVVRHYILLGDPATRLRRPERAELTVQATEVGLTVTGTSAVPSGRAVVTVERARDKLPASLGPMPDPQAADFPARMAERCALANETALLRAEAEVADGAFRVQLPAPLPAGAAWVRVLVSGPDGTATGAAALVGP